VKLICFPFAGGGSQTYRGWAKDLGIEVVVAPLPGRELRGREPLRTQMTQLVDDLVPRLAAATTGTYALFGHSMGGKIVFAIARELERRGVPGPRCAIISGAGAPHLPDRFPPIHALPEPELIAELREYGGMQPEILAEPELLEYFLPILRADLEVSETYRVAATDTIATPIVALGGTEDPFVNREELEGWAALTTGGAEARFVDGGHFFIHDRRAEVLALVRGALARSR
jgi:medium-chain acyl-[acyl-carrier-protein] hydrolase